MMDSNASNPYNTTLIMPIEGKREVTFMKISQAGGALEIDNELQAN